MLAMLSCSTPQMLLDDQLASQSVMMPVKGRQGWMLNQEVSFGPYTTDKVSRGWTRSYNIDLFLLGLESAREKYSFNIMDGQEAFTALCAHQVKGVDIPVDRFINANTSKDLFSFTLQTKDVFTATIIDNANVKPWYLLIANRDDFRKNGKYVGVLTNHESVPITIEPVRKLQDQKTVGMDVVGFEFKEGDQVIGAVEVLNQGKVWVSNALDHKKKLLLATASTALLLQNDLYFQADAI